MCKTLTIGIYIVCLLVFGLLAVQSYASPNNDSTVNTALLDVIRKDLAVTKKEVKVLNAWIVVG